MNVGWHKKKDSSPSPAIQSVASAEAFAAGQFDLREFAPRDNIEVSIDWFRLLQNNVYPGDPGVRYYFVAKGNKPTLILPLKFTTRGKVRSVESLTNYYTALYSPLLAAEGNLSALKDMLKNSSHDHKGAHVMRFVPMDTDSPAYAELQNALRQIGWIPFRFFCFGNWFLRVDDPWDGYLKKRSANLRSSIKRRSKEFSAKGGTLEIITREEDIASAIADFQEVYSASWKIPEPYPDFVPSLIRHLASIGMLRLGIARLNGRPIAAQLWIAGEGKASIYKVAYHKAFASLSPGTVLTSHLLRHAIEQDRVREVDFLIGDDEYKPYWMSDRRERWGIVAYNPRTAIGLMLLTKEVSGRIAKLLGRKSKAAFLKLRRNGTSGPLPGTDTRAKQFRPHASQRDQSMNWTVHPIALFPEFASQWDALIRSRPGTPFLESAFLQPCLDTFGSSNELLCLLHAKGRLRSAAIMQRDRKGTWQTFQPSQLPLGAWVSDDSVNLVQACNDLVRQLPGWTLGIGVSQLDPRIQERPENSPIVRTQDYIQTAWVDIEGDFGAYWETRGKNLKQNTRKQRNKLQSEGIEPLIECITSPEDVRLAIEDYGVLEGSGWKASDGTAIQSDNTQGHFYRKMLENFCAQGRGRIYRYCFGEKVVAMDLCINDDSTIVILKTAYDASYKTISPSTLMRHDQFQQLFEERKFQRIEFYGKLMEWHTRWTGQSRTLYHATIYRWAWLKKMHATLSVPANPQPQESAPADPH